MAYEIKLEHRTAHIELLNRSGNKVLLAVDDRKYELDIVMVEKGVYSILYNGHSYNVELIEGESGKEYIANTFARSFVAEIIDAETKYLQNRLQGTEHKGENDISSPMPGKAWVSTALTLMATTAPFTRSTTSAKEAGPEAACGASAIPRGPLEWQQLMPLSYGFFPSSAV